MVWNKKKNNDADNTGNDNEMDNAERPVMITLSEHLKMQPKDMHINYNVLLVGSSGSGKTYNFIRPNITTGDDNFIITDPSGELYTAFVEGLENKGYEVDTVNLVIPEKGLRYNPFCYIHGLRDINGLADIFINATKSDKDELWDRNVRQLLVCIMSLLWEYYPADCQTFSNVLRLASVATEDTDDKKDSDFEITIEQLTKNDKNSATAKIYRSLKADTGNSFRNIAKDLKNRLCIFRLSDIAYLTDEDTLNLSHFDDRKRALFVVTPTADDTFDFITCMLYTQMINELIRQAEKLDKVKVPLRHHTTLYLDVMDDKSIGAIPELGQKAVMIRKYNIGITISVQSIPQFADTFGSSWETVISSCDTKVFLSADDSITGKYISDLMGVSEHSARAVLTDDELARFHFDRGLCLIKIQGCPAILDNKYDYKSGNWIKKRIIPDRDGTIILSDKNRASVLGDNNSHVYAVHFENGYKSSKGNIKEMLKKADPDKADETADSVLQEDENSEKDHQKAPDKAEPEVKNPRILLSEYESEKKEKEDDQSKEGMQASKKNYTVNEALKLINIKEERIEKYKKQIKALGYRYVNVVDNNEHISDKDKQVTTKKIKDLLFEISEEYDAIADIRDQIKRYDMDTVPEEQQMWGTTIEEIKHQLPGLKAQKEFLQELASSVDAEYIHCPDKKEIQRKEAAYDIQEIDHDLYALTFKIATYEECIEESYATDEVIEIGGEIWI